MNSTNLIGIVSAIIALLSALGALLSARHAHLSSQMASAMMYKETNKFFFENPEVIPLTPYKSLGEQDKDIKALKIRVTLLETLNRFKFSLSKKDDLLHIKFREAIMGNSMGEFSDKIIARNGTREFAELASEELLKIKEKEPYLDKDFWDKYFENFKWNDRL